MHSGIGIWLKYRIIEGRINKLPRLWNRAHMSERYVK